MIRRGTTPTLLLLVKDQNLTGSTVYVTIRQKDTIVTKSNSQVLMAYDSTQGTLLTVKLTQQDTLKFKGGVSEVQVRWIKSNSDAYATDIEELDVERALLEGVITYA